MIQDFLMFIRISRLSICVTVLLAGQVGCDQDEIRVYQAPKDPSQPSPISTTASPPSAMKPSSMDWTVPAGWQQQPGQRSMRVATFEAGRGGRTVEIAVSAFPNRAGGLLPNVNRWRGQINLAPISQQDLATALVAFSNQGVRGYTLDFTGNPSDSDEASPERIIGGIIDGVGMTWFVKAKDESSILESLKGEIDQFTRSFRLRESSAVHDPPSATAKPNEIRQDRWRPPPHWKQDTTPSTILLSAYNIHTPKGHARATVTALVGDGGGLLPNVNRWRHQLGLPPVSTLDEQSMISIRTLSGDPSVAAFDLLAQSVGSEGRRRFLVAALSHQNKTWYVKLTGPDLAVELEKQAFEELVASIRSSHINP